MLTLSEHWFLIESCCYRHRLNGVSFLCIRLLLPSEFWYIPSAQYISEAWKESMPEQLQGSKYKANCATVSTLMLLHEQITLVSHEFSDVYSWLIEENDFFSEPKAAHKPFFKPVWFEWKILILIFLEERKLFKSLV